MGALKVIFNLINDAISGVNFITVWIVILLVVINQQFSFSTFQRQKKHPESDHSNSIQRKSQTPDLFYTGLVHLILWMGSKHRKFIFSS